MSSQIVRFLDVLWFSEGFWNDFRNVLTISSVFLLGWSLLVLLSRFFFLSLTFLVCHDNRDCLLSTEFKTLLIWTWMYYSFFFFFLVCVNYFGGFLKFPCINFCFISLWKDAFLMLSPFSPTAFDYYGTLNLPLGYIDMNSAAVINCCNNFFIFVIWSKPFRYFLKNIKLISFS